MYGLIMKSDKTTKKPVSKEEYIAYIVDIGKRLGLNSTIGFDNIFAEVDKDKTNDHNFLSQFDLDTHPYPILTIKYEITYKIGENGKLDQIYNHAKDGKYLRKPKEVMKVIH